tara:strand:+ start:187 stop:924 length:738 start_codon:yes stop_codon:yes gene_type:complete
MKTWQQFNDAVNDLLLVDGVRKGRGIERFRDRHIVNGVRDLQRFISTLRTFDSSKTYGASDFTTHSEGKVQYASFDYELARILDIVIRRLPTEENNQETSVYYRPTVYPASYLIHLLDGGTSARTIGFPGKVVFDKGKLYTAPLLRDDETMSVEFNQEKNYKPLFEASAAEKSEVTKLGDDEVLAVFHYVKYHFDKDVNADSAASAGNLQIYQQLRRSIYANRRETVETSNPAPIDTTQYVIGNG